MFVGKKLATCVMVIAATSMIAGCWLTPEEREYTLAGAGAGALVGAGMGCGIAAAVDSSSSKGYEIGCPVGAAVGAIAGAGIGYAMAPHPTPVPTPVPPPPPSPPPPPPPAPVAQKLVLRGVHFDFNKANIRPGDAAVLDEAAATLKQNPKVTINVNGYCDSIGSDSYNLKLSQRRAEAVVNYLVQQGIPATQLAPNGYGKTDFVASNDTAEGRAQNRRVELVPIQ